MITRREFLVQSAAAGATAWLTPELALATAKVPTIQFPHEARERIAIASYPFRHFINGPDDDGAAVSPHRIDSKDFAAHVIEKFKIDKIEPWSAHFASTDPKYLDQFRAALDQAKARVVNIAVDGEHSPYSRDKAERAKAVDFSKHWVDVAVAIGSPGIRTNLPEAKDSKPDLDRTAESLAHVIEYASAKGVVISLENDNPVSEDPFFLVKLVEKVNSPWLHTLPDFANTLAKHDPDYAYKGVDSMFEHAYSICHVKNSEANDNGGLVHVDMSKTFGFLKQHEYKGYCSMEFDSSGDPYQGTADLIETTLRYLA